jgi:hypothetical protein
LLARNIQGSLSSPARDVPDIGENSMGRGILLWLLGVPIPIIIILALIWH